MKYEDQYGRQGMPPDLSRCAASVSGSIWDSYSQCSRKATCDPDESGAPTTCKQHSDSTRDKRREKSDAAFAKSMRRVQKPREYRSTLKAIAGGHNDPQRLARDVLAEFEDSE